MIFVIDTIFEKDRAFWCWISSKDGKPIWNQKTNVLVLPYNKNVLNNNIKMITTTMTDKDVFTNYNNLVVEKNYNTSKIVVNDQKGFCIIYNLTNYVHDIVA